MAAPYRTRREIPDAGMLNERLTIQYESRVSNGQGGYTTTWAGVMNGEIWANIHGLSGGEAMNAGVQRAVQQWRVTIRRRDSVSPKNRLLWGDVVMNIVAAMPLPAEPKNFTLLMCESGAIA